MAGKKAKARFIVALNIPFISYRKSKIEFAVSAKMAGKAVETIKEASTTGKIGDGKIFTLDLQDAVRIRTSETGESAL